MKRRNFLGLNYTLANEDSAFEYSVLNSGVGHVLSIAGSGCRVVPLLARGPKLLTCVDLSHEQLAITELRLEGIRCLSHSEYLAFWAYPTHPGLRAQVDSVDRKELFQKIETLSPSTRSFFWHFFEERNWESPLYAGRYEQSCRYLSWVIGKVLGAQRLKLFEGQDLAEQRAYLESRFPTHRWTGFIYLYSQLLSILWRMNPGRFPRKNNPQSFYQIYRGSFDRMFQNTFAQENLLLQMIFFGQLISARANPLECVPATFHQAKAALATTEVSYVQGDVIRVIQESSKSIDFISFSNAPSYFPKQMNQDYLSIIFPKLSRDAQLVVRNFLHLGRDTVLSGYLDISGEHKELADLERTQSYDIRVYRKESI